MKRLVVAVAVTWAWAVFGVVQAVYTGQWMVAPWAISSAIASAGWFMAARQWALWRTLALAYHPSESDSSG